ncbi:general secretion pathway protein D [Duganella sp. 3397]|uniref:cohesin domain-containing protein n=1 Tax=Duganella sp. 3397 TaxID=2817732 RepID=UPI00285E119A|nr:cohesin domain-containing protein [Duganella sp. 3397]MDR7050141.1 general secretion pathway protein D [Duganella sp. 3397]
MRWAGALCGAALLAGCGTQYIRDEAQRQIAAGKFEQALQAYDTALQGDPESVVLRTGQISARDTIMTRLLTDAATARARGNDARAREILQRALAIQAGDDRAKAMLLEIERDARQKAAVASARELIDKGLRERAALVIEAALKDTPKNTELLGLQRQLELASKQSELAVMRLSESRPISLDFRDANLRMVLEALTRNSGVNFVLDKDVRQDLRTTIFLRQTRLDDALELLTSTSQLTFKVLDPSTVLIYPKTADKAREYQDLVIRAFYLSSADVKQTALLLKSMLKIREPFIDEKLNLIMVRETPETVRLAERLIALHDMAEPEVMMEVEVLEIKRSSLTELGIRYPDGFNLTPLAPAGSDGFTLGNVRSLNRDSIGINLPDVRINLHRDVGDVNILANPKIRARNREKAKVMIGDKLPVVTTTGSSNNNSFISESVQYVDVGLKLEVEPNITLDDEVAIKVGLEVSSLVREVKTSAGSLVYQIGTRTASTVLRLRDGETQILAGLINNEERMSASRVPGLGDVPLLGRLFSSQRDDGQRTEIVLSITPRIVRNVRRPDLNQAEFWSGTENDVRSRPLTLPPAEKPAAAPGGATAPAVPGMPPAAAPMMAPGPEVMAIPAPPVQQVVVSMVGPKEVKAGDTFTVHVNVKSDTALRGMPVKLQYSPQSLQAIDAEEGAFFTQDGASASGSKALDQATGVATMAVLRNGAAGVKGEGTMASFKFKALKAGPGEIRVLSAKPVSVTPVEAPTSPTPLYIMVK